MNYINQTFQYISADLMSETLNGVAAVIAKDIRTALVAADSGITALTGNETGVLINNKFKILIESQTNSSSKGILFTVRNDSTDLFSFSVACQGSNYQGGSGRIMKINIHMGICDNGFSMIIRNVFTTGDNFSAQIIAVTTTNGVTAVGYNTNSSNPSAPSSTRNFASAMTLFDLRNNARSLTLAHRLAYYHEATNENIATLSNKVLLSGDMRVGDVDIIDCSTVTGDSTCPYNDAVYYAIDNNTLIPVG